MYIDPDETREVQEKRIEYFKKKSDQHFTDDGRGAAVGEDLHYDEVFSGTLHGPDGGTMFVEDCETGVLAKTRRRTPKGYQKFQTHRFHIGDVEWYATCIILRLEKEKNLRDGRNCTWERLMG